MQLEFLEDINNYQEDIIRLYGFDSAEAIKFKSVIDKLIVDQKNIDLSTLDFIQAINCDLSLRVSETDEGITASAKGNFNCDLTLESYKRISTLIEPFCKKESRGFQWLYELDTPIDFLFSPGGKW